MTGRTHLMLGLAAALATAAVAPPEPALRIAIIGVGAVGSLLPDVDHPKSIISGWLPGVGGAVRLLASHRGPTHSIGFVLALLALLAAAGLSQWIIAAAAAGLISHILADMLTVKGVPVLIPLSRRSWRLAPYMVLNMTGWILESVATVGALAAIGFILWKGL